MWLRTVFTSLMIGILGLTLAGCDGGTGSNTPPGDTAATTQPETQTSAPADLPETLPQVDLEGINALIEETAASDRVLVLDFWATWCVPCVEMFPDIHKLGKELGDDVRVVSITVDSPGDYEQKAIKFLSEHDSLTDAYLLDPEGDEQVRVVDAIGPSWQNVAVPAIFVYDREEQMVGEFLSGPVGPILEQMREAAKR